MVVLHLQIMLLLLFLQSLRFDILWVGGGGDMRECQTKLLAQSMIYM